MLNSLWFCCKQISELKMQENNTNWCQSSLTCIKRTTEEFTWAGVWKSFFSSYIENPNVLMMKGMSGEPEACSALMLIPTLVLQTGKVKRKWFASCWQQHWACLNHTSFQIPPRTEMNSSPFFFWMLKTPCISAPACWGTGSWKTLNVTWLVLNVLRCLSCQWYLPAPGTHSKKAFFFSYYRLFFISCPVRNSGGTLDSVLWWPSLLLQPQLFHLICIFHDSLYRKEKGNLLLLFKQWNNNIKKNSKSGLKHDFKIAAWRYNFQFLGFFCFCSVWLAHLDSRKIWRCSPWALRDYLV